MDKMRILQNFSVDVSKVIKQHIKDIKKLDPKTQRELGNLIGDFKEGLDNLSTTNESVNESRVPKMYVKYRAVIKKIKELEEKQKELAQPYFDARSKGDMKTAKSQLELMKQNQKQLTGYRKNLASIESKYIDNMDYFPGE
jgi:uncharacterized protein (UPF0335 family)